MSFLKVGIEWYPLVHPRKDVLQLEPFIASTAHTVQSPSPNKSEGSFSSSGSVDNTLSLAGVGPILKQKALKTTDISRRWVEDIWPGTSLIRQSEKLEETLGIGKVLPLTTQVGLPPGVPESLLGVTWEHIISSEKY